MWYLMVLVERTQARSARHTLDKAPTDCTTSALLSLIPKERNAC